MAGPYIKNPLIVVQTGSTPTSEDPEPLKFESENANTLRINYYDDWGMGVPPDVSFEYSYDKETWTSLPINTAQAFGDGQILYVRGYCLDGTSAKEISQDFGDGEVGYTISTTDSFNVSGDVMSLVSPTYRNYMLGGMAYLFRFAKVVDASGLRLPGDDIGFPTYAFKGMFFACTSLTAAPVLPATKLRKGCYQYMFSGCTNLTTAPELPATTLADYCYQYMFQNCRALTAASELPATTLATYCYSEMFYGCSSLVVAPDLPATTLANYCYSNMFWNCTALTTAPTLPATTLANYCYQYMFRYCASLTTAPELPATTLADNCYRQMFQGCTSLTASPALPATTLASNCYNLMFSGCTSLASIPELPATTLANSCYSRMFSDCSAIKMAETLSEEYPNTYTFGTSPTNTYASNMFASTGGTFTGTPTVQTYYTSNTIVTA